MRKASRILPRQTLLAGLDGTYAVRETELMKAVRKAQAAKSAKSLPKPPKLSKVS